MFSEIKQELVTAIKDKKNWGIIVFGDFNRQQKSWEKSKILDIPNINIGKPTHLNLKSGDNSRSDLQRLYTRNVDISTEIIEQTLGKVSDHAMIRMKCKQKLISDGNTRSTIPNVHTSLRLHEMIRGGKSWKEIDN